MNISAVLRELMAAGLTGDELISAVERIEDADQSAKQTTRAARNRRYQDRLKARKAAEQALEPVEGNDDDKTLKTSKTSQPSYEPSPKAKVSPDPSKNPTPISNGGERSVAKSTKGHRLPADFQLTESDRAFAAERGWTAGQVAEGEAEFIDHWSSEPDPKGRKLDWSRTWRNRVRRLPAPQQRGAAPRQWSPRDNAATTLLKRDRMEREADEQFDPFDDRGAGGRSIGRDESPRGSPRERGGVGGTGPILDLEPIRTDRE